MIYEYFVHEAIMLCIFTVNVMALNLALGYTGIINLGHVALFGFGAYSSALLTKLLGINVWLAILISGILALLLGLLMAIPTLRIKKDYFSLVMLGLNFILFAVSRNWVSFTRGALGLPGITRLSGDNNIILLISAAFVVLAYIAIKSIVRSKAGIVLQGIRDDELSVSVLGKNVLAHKAFALAVAAFFAGISGSLLAHYLTYIDPTIFDLGYLIFILSALNIGGLGSLEGSILGSLVLGVFTVSIKFIGFGPQVLGPLREILYSLLLILVLIYAPRGILGKVDLE